MSEIRYDSFAQREEAIEEARSAQTQAQQQAQQAQTQQTGNDALRFKRQRLLKMRQAAARRRAGMQLQARFAASRAAAERTRGSRSMKLLNELKPRKKAAKQEKPHGEHKTHGETKAHERTTHAEHPHGPHEADGQRRTERLDRDGGQGSGRQQQEQHEERAPIVKVKLSKRISPSAIRSDLRHLADDHEDEPLRLETQMRLAWTRTCLGFGAALSVDPKAAVTPLVLGSSLDLIAARFRHNALRDATRQTGLLGVKHQLQTVQDEPSFRPNPTADLAARQKDLNVLKPLFVLHGERPYTRAQLRLSVCRVRTLLFATGQTVDPAQALRAERAARAAHVGQTAVHTEPASEASHDEDDGKPERASQNF